MHLIKLIPTIETTDIQATVDFYVNHFDFLCLAINKEWGWAKISLQDTEFMIALPNEHRGFVTAAFTGSFYFRVEGIEELWKKIIQTDIKVAYALETFDFGMREFAVYDNNGYMLQFGEEIRN